MSREGTIINLKPRGQAKNGGRNPKKSRTQLLTGLYHANGVTLEKYIPNALLKPDIRIKRSGSLSKHILLQHDDAWPHTTRAAPATMQDLKLKCLSCSPYSLILLQAIVMSLVNLKKSVPSNTWVALQRLR